MRNIRSLGTLPADAFDKYTSFSLKQVMSKLKKCNEKLKKFGHVNKKAIDQFASFREQREQLVDRRAELDRGREAVGLGPPERLGDRVDPDACGEPGR